MSPLPIFVSYKQSCARALCAILCPVTAERSAANAPPRGALANRTLPISRRRQELGWTRLPPALPLPRASATAVWPSLWVDRQDPRPDASRSPSGRLDGARRPQDAHARFFGVNCRCVGCPRSTPVLLLMDFLTRGRRSWMPGRAAPRVRIPGGVCVSAVLPAVICCVLILYAL